VFLEQAKLWTNTSQQMADKFHNYFTACGSNFTANTQKFQAANNNIGNVIRKSVAIVALEQCLNPVSAAMLHSIFMSSSCCFAHGTFHSFVSFAVKRYQNSNLV
jgi:hypothetical protein